MHRRVVITAVVAILMLHAAAALAHGPNQPPHQQYRIGDLKLESGEVIRDFAISDVTHGTLNARSPTRSSWSPPSAAITTQADVLPWLKAQEDALIALFDANDWIYQTWAYDAPTSAPRPA